MDDDTPAPPNFLKTLFHDVVDAGADVVVGGGPHSLRGIEIYKGKPIFYGIGVFFIRGEIKAMQEAAFRVFPDPTTGRAPPPEPESESVRPGGNPRSEEHTSELKSLMRISYPVFCWKKQKNTNP